jgi:HlyD family secretion protein
MSIAQAQVQKAQMDLAAQQHQLDLLRRKNKHYSDEEIRKQRETVESYRALYEIAAENLDKTVMYSPADGVVTSRELDEGEVATFGSTVVTVMTEVENEIEADVPESDIVKVIVGQKAIITFDALESDEEFEAEVTEIDPASTVIQDVVYYKIRLKLLATDKRIKPGMSVDADIKTAEKNNVIAVPLRAVKTEGDQEYVEVLTTDEQVKKINVETGLEGDDGEVEITSGLRGSEEVITFTKNGE